MSTPNPDNSEKKEFHVGITRTSYGYVRVHARNKNEAERAVKQMRKQKLLGYYKERCTFINIDGAKPVGKMIEILNCELEGDVTETPIFEVRGTYEDEDFTCRVELRFPPEEDPEDYEHLDGADLSPAGFDVLEELINEVYDTEAYQDASEEFAKLDPDLDELPD